MEDNKNVNENEEVIVEENLEEVAQQETVEEVLEGNEILEGEEITEEESKEDELAMLRKNKDEVKRLTNEVETLKERLLRVTAEYENFRKRTVKEKEGIYTEACVDVIKEILPVADNLQRAMAAEGNIEDLKKGVEMTIKGLDNSFEKLGIEEVDASGEFNPNLHQAVMHVEDEALGKNAVAEVFMKGYKRGEKVIRHTVCKVAN